MSNTNAAFPTASILGLLFITLKLTGALAWSWWWVLSPFWLPLAAGVAAGLLYFSVLALIFTLSIIFKK